MIMRETGVGGERGVNNRKVELRLVGGGGGGCNDDFRDRSDFVDRVNNETCWLWLTVTALLCQAAVLGGLEWVSTVTTWLPGLLEPTPP